MMPKFVENRVRRSQMDRTGIIGILPIAFIGLFMMISGAFLYTEGGTAQFVGVMGIFMSFFWICASVLLAYLSHTSA